MDMDLTRDMVDFESVGAHGIGMCSMQDLFRKKGCFFMFTDFRGCAGLRFYVDLVVSIWYQSCLLSFFVSSGNAASAFLLFMLEFCRLLLAVLMRGR